MTKLHKIKAAAWILLFVTAWCVGTSVCAAGATISVPFPKPTDIFIQQPAWPNIDPALTDKAHASIIGLATQPTDSGPDFESQYRNNVDIAHKAGLKFTIWLSTVDIEEDFDLSKRPELYDTPCVDINGNKVVRKLSGKYQMCTNNPTWKAFLYEVSKRAIDWGVDGIAIDEIMGNYETLNPGVDGCFCKYCIQGFNDYMKRKYTAKELKKLGIDDISKFNYGVYIKTRYLNMYKGNIRWTDTPLYKDFGDYQLSSIHGFLQGLITDMKAYGKKAGKDIYFSANISGMDQRGLALTSQLNYVSSEITYELPPKGRAVSLYKLAGSLGTPLYATPSSLGSDAILARNDMTDLMKLYTAEAYSSGGYLNVPYRLWSFSQEQMGKGSMYYADMNELGPYYGFITENKQCYDNAVSKAQIAVLYSVPSARYYFDRFTNNFQGICNFLTNSHLQYDVINAGDNDWIKDKLNADSLKKYNILILPNAADISDSQINTFLAYIKSGGYIWAFGKTGTGNEKDSPAIRPEWSKLCKEGTSNLGKGKMIYSGDDSKGINYMIKGSFADMQAVTNLLKSRDIYSSIMNTNSNVIANEYWNQVENEHIIHLVNFNYDTKVKKLNIQKNINVSTFIDAGLKGKSLGVYYISPDFSGIKDLRYEIKGGRVYYNIGDLNYYGVVVISEKDKFKARWSIDHAASGIIWRGLAGEPDLTQQLQSAEKDYGTGRYSAACITADSVQQKIEETYAEKALDKARKAEVWSKNHNRTYRMDKVEEQLSKAEKYFAAKDFADAGMYAEKAVAAASITIDGSMKEWEGISPLATDAVGDNTGGGPDIESVYSVVDDEYFYAAVKILGNRPHVLLMLICDGKDSVQFHINAEGGEESGTVFLMAPPAEPKCIGGFSLGYGDVLEFKVPLSLLGNPESIRLSIEANTGKPDYKHSDEISGWYDVPCK